MEKLERVFSMSGRGGGQRLDFNMMGNGKDTVINIYS